MFYDDMLFQAVTTAMDLDVPMSLMPLVITNQAALLSGMTSEAIEYRACG